MKDVQDRFLKAVAEHEMTIVHDAGLSRHITLKKPTSYIWRYSPRSFICRVIWNCSELMQLPCPYAPEMFGFIVGARASACSQTEGQGK